ncbi:MAG: hypothetical protein ACJ0F4_01890 [Gammaproteobacteria bacterium]
MSKLWTRIGKVVLWIVAIACAINIVLITYAYRDNSWQLHLMFFNSLVLYPMSIWYLHRLYYEKPMLWFTSQSETGRLVNHYVLPSELNEEELNYKEEEDDEFKDLEEAFFDSLH